MPKVSVIVPNYNHATYLQQRIDSILNQTYQDFELILLDDCSTDNSREVLNRYRHHPKVAQIIFNETNSGSTFRQWNKGIELATGEYIWIAESDDWAEPEFLTTLLSLFPLYPSVGLAYTTSKFIDSKGNLLWEKKGSGGNQFYTGQEYILRKLLLFNSINNVSMVVFRKSLYEQINHPLYENMIFCGDWLFYVLLCEHTNVIEHQKAYNNYRIHQNNVSTKAEKEGLSFLEGIRVLDYICDHYPVIKAIDYSFQYAKYWNQYKKQYQFSKRTNQLITNSFSKNHKLIIVAYYLIAFKRRITRILKGQKETSKNSF